MFALSIKSRSKTRKTSADFIAKRWERILVSWPSWYSFGAIRSTLLERSVKKLMATANYIKQGKCQVALHCDGGARRRKNKIRLVTSVEQAKSLTLILPEFLILRRETNS